MILIPPERGSSGGLFIFLDSLQCRYIPTEMLLCMEMPSDIDSLVVVGVP